MPLGQQDNLMGNWKGIDFERFQYQAENVKSLLSIERLCVMQLFSLLGVEQLGVSNCIPFGKSSTRFPHF